MIPPKLIRLAPKIFVGVLLFMTLVQAVRNGDFKSFKNFNKKFSLRFYLPLLISFPIVIACLLPFDSFFRSVLNASPWLKGITEFGSFIGDNFKFWMIFVGIHLVLRWMKKEDWAKKFFGAVLGGAFAGLTVHLLKFVFLRARPYVGLGPFTFFDYQGFLSDHRGFQSFPSGDVALVAGAASYLFYSTKSRFRWLIFLLPLSTALARVYLDRHWVTDTVGSIFLGLILSRLVGDYLRTEP